MNREYTAMRLNEDFEDNFATTTDNKAIKARAGMTLSTLGILSDYLKSIIADVAAEGSAV